MPNNDRLLIQILLLALLGAGLWVMAPFISALLWGAILAFASWPLMRLLTRVLGGRETLAASLLTAVWIPVVALPLVWLGFNLADHIRDATAFIRDVQVDGLPDAPDWLGSIPGGERLVRWWDSMDQQGAALLASVKPHLGQVGNWLLARSAQIGSGALELTLSLVFVFFFYRDGPRLAAFVLRLLQRLMGNAPSITGPGGWHRAARGQRRDRHCRGPRLAGFDRLPDRRCAGRHRAGAGDLHAQPDSHGAAAGLDTCHRLAGVEG